MILLNFEIRDYSLRHSLECLDKMGKLFPIVKESDESCTLTILDKYSNPILLRISQVHDTIIVSQLTSSSCELDEGYVLAKVKHIFDLDNDKYQSLSADSLGNNNVIEDLRGLRIIRDELIYNSIVRTIISQQISLKAAYNTVKRLIETYGERVIFDGETFYSFPKPDTISVLSQEELRAIGIPKTRANSIIEVSRIFSDELLEDGDFSLISKRLLDIKGIGNWTVEMLGLFYYVDANTVPYADIGLHRAIEFIEGREHKSLNTKNIKSITDGWCGNKALLVYYVWEYWMINK